MAVKSSTLEPQATSLQIRTTNSNVFKLGRDIKGLNEILIPFSDLILPKNDLLKKSSSLFEALREEELTTSQKASFSPQNNPAPLELLLTDLNSTQLAYIDCLLIFQLKAF